MWCVCLCVRVRVCVCVCVCVCVMVRQQMYASVNLVHLLVCSSRFFSVPFSLDKKDLFLFPTIIFYGELFSFVFVSFLEETFLL